MKKDPNYVDLHDRNDLFESDKSANKEFFFSN